MPRTKRNTPVNTNHIMKKSDLVTLLRFAENTARRAGLILKKGFGKPQKVRLKGRIDPVTEYDLASEKLILSRISKAYPGHSILSEESGARAEGSVLQWVIDPLDGTVNFAHGFPVYCVSIALQLNGQTIVGAVYDPERDEMFSAAAGMGAHLNGTRMRVSIEKSLQRALLATGFAYNVDKARRNNLGLFARMVKTAQAVRRPGSAALDLCWLAAGRIDGFWELYLHPWDTAAAILFVTEAGGQVTRLDGSPYSVFSQDILASNRHLHRPLSRALCQQRR